MFGGLMLVVLALALLIAPALAAQSVNGDRERGTLAPLQITGLTSWDLALGKLLAPWGTGAIFLLVTAPLALWCFFEGGLGIGRIVAVYAVMTLLIGVICAISLGLSAWAGRTTTSSVLAYLAVFALTAGTGVLFALMLAVTSGVRRGDLRGADVQLLRAAAGPGVVDSRTQSVHRLGRCRPGDTDHDDPAAGREHLRATPGRRPAASAR
ncbi:MAG: hypothetical protein WKF47_03050 [Geodermatophilaceae bacterium]